MPRKPPSLEKPLARFVRVAADFSADCRTARGVQVCLDKLPPNGTPCVCIVVEIESQRPAVRTHFRVFFQPDYPSLDAGRVLWQAFRHHECELRSFAASLLMRDASLSEEA